MDIAVLGSTSFAGGCFVDYALAQGASVLGISRSNQPPPALNAYHNNKNLGNFRYHRLDLNQSFEEISKVLEVARPKYVVDFAGQGMVAQSWDAPEQWYMTNIVSKVRLHKFLSTKSWLMKYVRISTPEVYGSTDDKITTTTSLDPSTPYAVSHAAIDLSLNAFHKQFQFPVVFTKFANFYGPTQQLYRIVPRACICATTGSTLFLDGGGKTIRSFIYGSDVASAVWLSMLNGHTGFDYHFSASEFVSIEQLVDKIAALQGVCTRDFVEISEERPGKDRIYRLDPTFAKQQLGWSQEVSLDEGLDRTLAWTQKYLDEIVSLPQHYVHKI